MKKQKVDKSVVITGMIALTVVEAIALLLGHNGVFISIFIAIIAAAIGVHIPKELFYKK